jgi:hypothetical protein
MGEQASDLSEPLSWNEICERFPEEWVALVDIEWVNDRDFEFRSARVAGHGKRRREPMQHAASLWASYAEIGHFYTGRVRAPMAPLLAR